MKKRNIILLIIGIVLTLFLILAGSHWYVANYKYTDPEAFSGYSQDQITAEMEKRYDNMEYFRYLTDEYFSTRNRAHEYEESGTGLEKNSLMGKMKISIGRLKLLMMGRHLITCSPICRTLHRKMVLRYTTIYMIL